MITKKGLKYFFNLDNSFQLFLAKIFIKSKGTLFFKKKMELLSRNRKEEQKGDKEIQWLSGNISEANIEKDNLQIRCSLYKSWLKKEWFSFKVGDQFQILPKNKVCPLLQKFIAEKEESLYVVFFFHELLKVFLFKDNKASIWLLKEFQYDAYYIDIKNYLVPLLKKLNEIEEEKEVLIYTSSLINEDLKDYLENYNSYHIFLGHENDEIYMHLNSKKKLKNKLILKDCSAIRLIEFYITEKWSHSSDPSQLYLCKKPQKIFIIPALFARYLEEYYQYLLMFSSSIVVINITMFKYSYYLPNGILIVYP